MPSKRPRLVVFFGGGTDNHDLSQETGYWFCQYAPRSQYDIIPVHVTTDGQWQVPLGTLPRTGPIDRMLTLLFKAVRPLAPTQGLERLLHQPVHSLFTTVRGRGGDDGSLASLGSALNIPVIGSNVETCQQTYSKPVCAARVDDIISTPINRTFKSHQPIEEIMESVEHDQLTFPLFVKPTGAEGSVGVMVAQNPGELKRAIQRVQPQGHFLVQEKAGGTELTVTVLPDEHGKPRILPPTVIIPEHAPFYDHAAKRKPGRVKLHTTTSETNPLLWEAEVIAREVYDELNCRGAVTIDLVAGEEGIKLLEVNTVPTFTQATALPQQLAQAHLHPTKMIDSLLRQTW